jgi:hypothetical protein
MYFNSKTILNFLVVLFLFSNFVMLSAESGKIIGTVVNKATNDPLPGANILIVGTSIGGATDLNGEFTIFNVPIGTQRVRVSFLGYKTFETTIAIADGQTLLEVYELESDLVEMDEISVTAQREGQLAAINQQLTAEGISNVVSSERIRELPDANAAESR